MLPMWGGGWGHRFDVLHCMAPNLKWKENTVTERKSHFSLNTLLLSWIYCRCLFYSSSPLHCSAKKLLRIENFGVWFKKGEVKWNLILESKDRLERSCYKKSDPLDLLRDRNLSLHYFGSRQLA